ncbi:hypothetical protein [Clostridium nigeriense]|uniref:hypothetical protein n=1 Tax=Clostridium nigeriense TaxID=1805470 RepID=UPI00082AB2DB|nr:hypothetical protein [Clostridium nigeriense]
MDCIEIDDILSTTVVYEDFFNYSEFFKISSDSIDKLKKIANKYTDRDNTFYIDNEESIYLKKHNDLYSREFIYKFKDYVSIKNIVYPLDGNDIVSCEIIDLSENKEVKILPIDVHKDIKNLDILLNNKFKVIKLKIKCRNNIFPKTQEIKIIKDIYENF